MALEIKLEMFYIYDLCELINLQIKKIKYINNSLFTVGGSKRNSISLNELTKICEKISGNTLNISKIKKHLFMIFHILLLIIQK